MLCKRWFQWSERESFDVRENSWRVFEVEPLKAHHYYFVEWGNQVFAVTSSADLLAVLLKASPAQPEIRICTEK